MVKVQSEDNSFCNRNRLYNFNLTDIIHLIFYSLFALSFLSPLLRFVNLHLYSSFFFPLCKSHLLISSSPLTISYPLSSRVVQWCGLLSVHLLFCLLLSGGARPSCSPVSSLLLCSPDFSLLFYNPSFKLLTDSQW